MQIGVCAYDAQHIGKLGGWESLDMVLRYTRSVKFDESLRLYRGMERRVSAALTLALDS